MARTKQTSRKTTKDSSQSKLKPDGIGSENHQSESKTSEVDTSDAEVPVAKTPKIVSSDDEDERDFKDGDLAKLTIFADDDPLKRSGILVRIKKGVIEKPVGRASWSSRWRYECEPVLSAREDDGLRFSAWENMLDKPKGQIGERFKIKISGHDVEAQVKAIKLGESGLEYEMEVPGVTVKHKDL